MPAIQHGAPEVQGKERVTSSVDKFSGKNFVRGNFRRNSNFGEGPSDTGSFDTPNPWFLVDNQLCETLGSEKKIDSLSIGPPS